LAYRLDSHSNHKALQLRVRLYETDGQFYEQIVDIVDEFDLVELFCKNRTRRIAKGSEDPMEDGEKSGTYQLPLLSVLVDPFLEMCGTLLVAMPMEMWLHQLTLGNHVVAQARAIAAIAANSTSEGRKALYDVLGDQFEFHRVRARAAWGRNFSLFLRSLAFSGISVFLIGFFSLFFSFPSFVSLSLLPSALAQCSTPLTEFHGARLLRDWCEAEFLRSSERTEDSAKRRQNRRSGFVLDGSVGRKALHSSRMKRARGKYSADIGKEHDIRRHLVKSATVKALGVTRDSGGIAESATTDLVLGILRTFDDEGVVGYVDELVVALVQVWESSPLSLPLLSFIVVVDNCSHFLLFCCSLFRASCILESLTKSGKFSNSVYGGINCFPHFATA